MFKDRVNETNLTKDAHSFQRKGHQNFIAFPTIDSFSGSDLDCFISLNFVFYRVAFNVEGLW